MAPVHVVYGRHPVEQMLSAQPEAIEKLWLQQGETAAAPRLVAFSEEAARLGIAFEWAPRRRLERMAGAPTHQGVLLQVKPFAYAALDALAADGAGPPLILALDSVQDPHNLGALIRSALALGAHGLVFAKDRACEVTPTVVKAAAGATAHLPVARVVNLGRALASLKARGLWVVGTTIDAPVALDRQDLRGPTVIVVGSEGSGMRPGIAKACDHLVTIPMVGAVGSLNAAVAGSICLYEAARQRQGATLAAD